ncbi:Uncharacterized protein dnm_005830 [Desulfonema magnum]|uniref:Uncharacterized protein n=1 Tax=Desulfonema magnum TaxID=45655 RepID=A0A975GKB9_9BACT|nr:Uncharacterized protein dnm_005830 [Desulfonema magnum]
MDSCFRRNDKKKKLDYRVSDIPSAELPNCKFGTPLIPDL